LDSDISKGDCTVAQHGYLREYDEAPDRGDERDRGDRNRERDWSNRDRSFMFDRGRDRGEDRERGSAGYGREHGYGGFQGDFSRSGREQGGFGGRGDWERSPRNFSSHQDDHYRSWRDRQMAALDRDYADYCREREQQFHSDFDSWRRNRQQQPKPGRAASEPTLELNQPAAQATETGGTTSPMGAATLGTNNPENEGIGRGRR
jgi:hypothetical protein